MNLCWEDLHLTKTKITPIVRMLYISISYNIENSRWKVTSGDQCEIRALDKAIQGLAKLNLEYFQ